MFVRQGTKRIVIKRFKVSDTQGKEIAAYENFPGYDDHLNAEAFIMPKKPLDSGTTYRVNVEATDDKGKDIGKTWSFTTAASDLSQARTVASLQGALGIAPVQALLPLRRR